MIKFAVLCLCAAHLVSITREEIQAARNGMSTMSAHAQSTGYLYLNQGRQRRLFARRGQHERHKPCVLKHRVPSVFPNDLAAPSKVVTKPTKLKCSQLTQSCLPKSGCCDPGTTCHCRFFKSICSCRRTGERKPQIQK